MVIAHAKNNLVVGQDRVVKFINIILLHIYQGQVQGIILHQIAGADGAVFLQNKGDFRVLLVKGDEKLRKKDRAQHRRDSDSKRRLYSCHAGVVCLEFVAVLENVGGFFIKGLALLGEDQLVSFPIKKADPRSLWNRR